MNPATLGRTKLPVNPHPGAGHSPLALTIWTSLNTFPFNQFSSHTDLAATTGIPQSPYNQLTSVPSSSPHRRRRIPLLLLLLVLLIFGGLIGLWLAPATETAMPDQFDLGFVALDSNVELNARLLTSANLTPIELAHQKIAEKLPRALRPHWKHLDPQQFRGTNQQLDLATLHPKMSAPSHLRISKSSPRQYQNWYKNNPFLEVDFSLDTSRTGSFSGVITGKLGRRRASLPVRYTVEDRSHLPRAMVISPFTGDSTDFGTNFNEVVSVLSSVPARLDYLRTLPPSFDAYSLILLADSPLINHTAQHLDQLRALLNRGGRIILACNYFFRGTVGSANRLLEDFDFGVIDDESSGKVDCSNIIPDPLTANVKLIQVYRGSPINLEAITSASNVKPLVYGADGHCYVAVARPAAGGEIIVLTQSLWWHWVHQHSSTSDNAILLRNCLTLGLKSIDRR